MKKIKNIPSRIFFLLLFLIALSCNDIRRKKEITRLVETWQGREIIFPQQSVFMRYAKDTVDFVIPQDAPYKVLIYVDSLNLLNGFPSNMAFQTFLLNKDNRVLVIGNPVHNAAVKDLYIQEISQNNGKKSIIPPTMLTVENTEIDLGEVETETTKEIQIKLCNTGSRDFVFQGITTSCDCTEAECDQIMIPKGKSRKLTIRYKAEQAGDFMRTVSIYGNIPASPLMLTLTGMVIEKEK